MSAIIKSGSAVNVRPLSIPAPKPLAPKRTEPRIDPELVALRREAEVLRQDLAQRDEAIGGHDDAIDRAFRDGEAAGRMKGLTEADDGRAERIARLESTIERALQTFSEEVAALERLAGVLAVTGLEKVLGDPGDYAELLQRIVRMQIEKINGQAVLRIEVSPEDFPEPEALSRLGAASGRPEIAVVAVEALKAGDCRIKLLLGAIEVGVGQQWGQLRAILEASAEP